MRKIINNEGNVILGLIVAVVATALVAGGLVYSWQKKQGDTKIQEVQKQIQEKDSKVSDLEKQLAEQQQKVEEQVKQAENAPQEWVSYTSTNYNLSFFYPKGWVVNDSVSTEQNSFMGIGLTPPDIKEDMLWGILVYKSSETTVDKIIDGMGDQFTDRQVQKEKITINGLTATKIIVTTASNPNWYYEQVIVSKSGKIYAVSNGAVKDDKFSTFYNSLIIK